MVRAPFRRVRETRRELNAKVPTRPTRMLAMPPRDGDFLMESGRHLVPEELSRRHASDIVPYWPCASHARSENAHANCSVVSDPRQTITATPAVTRHQFQITPHLAERSDGHIADR
jgi:hypothetical protein